MHCCYCPIPPLASSRVCRIFHWRSSQRRRLQDLSPLASPRLGTAACLSHTQFSAPDESSHPHSRVLCWTKRVVLTVEQRHTRTSTTRVLVSLRSLFTLGRPARRRSSRTRAAQSPCLSAHTLSVCLITGLDGRKRPHSP